VDIGGFAEPRKILCQCALPSVEQLSVHPRSAHGGAGIPQQENLTSYHKMLVLMTINIMEAREMTILW
jgi:hypothetical protein